MSSIFGSEDPWENGWMDNDNNKKNSGISNFGGGSSYLTSSQLLSNAELNRNEEPTELNENTLPESYKVVESILGSKLASISALEYLVFDELISLGYFTKTQKTKIIDILYNYNILPASNPSNLYQILGLIALEIDTPGSGDYVSLQFKKDDYPPLPDNFVNEIKKHTAADKTPQIMDPLSRNLVDTPMDDNEWDTKASNPTIQDHVLADHANVSAGNNENKNGEFRPIDHSSINKYISDIREKFSPSVEDNDKIKIKEVPEKEGILFKHINYTITHDLKLGMNGSLETKRVIRRYSDFVWILEFLLKKYPFRVIPGLPPKKFSGSSPDSQFLQRRRRGLQRFLNQLVSHPVLKQEPVVITFLSVPTDIATWKKQAKVDYSLEFHGQKISSYFINSIWPTIGTEFLKNWSSAEASITKIIEVWTKVVLLVERYEKRQQQIAYDNGKFVEMINNFKTLNTDIYPISEDLILGSSNKDGVNSINDSLTLLSDFFNKTSQALVDESYAVNTVILERFKTYLDYLYSLQELFDRTKRLSVNTIGQLQTKIKENEAKYNKLSHEDADVKGTDLAKLRQIIINDKQEIFQQLNKDWLIKSCCFEEFVMFQETQYLISELWISWSKGRFKFSDILNKLNDNLNNDIINNMPFSH